MIYPQWKELLRKERLPAAVVDLNAFDRNIRKIAGWVNQAETPKSLRVATKSIRVPDLIARVVKFGRPYDGLMCYSAEEAVLLASVGLDNILVAYPTVQESDLQCLRGLHEQGTKISLVIDSHEHVAVLASAMKGIASPFAVVVEVDMSLHLFKGCLHLGVRRSPIRSPELLGTLVEKITSHVELEFLGVMAYEAQVAGVGDRNPFKPFLNPLVKLLRRWSVKVVARRRVEIFHTLQEKRHAFELFNGGGTGSLTYARDEGYLTEVTAGSGFLCSHLFDYYSNVDLEPACFFALQAVRSSDTGYVTCQGGGYIASGEAGADRLPRPHFPAGSKLVSIEGAGEVQTPVRVSANVRVRPGDPVLFRHAKAGELAERFNEYLLVSNGRVVSRAKTYRGLGFSFF